MKRIFLIFVLFINIFQSLYSYIDLDSIKSRLPGAINSFQPAIVPVTNFDETILYFDRKLFPDNTGGLNDKDDIWYCQRINEKFWSEPKRLDSKLNTVNSDVLFSLSPSSNSALIYGIYNDSAKTDGFSVIRNNNWNEPIPLNIKNYYNTGETFYGYLTPDENILLLSLERRDSKGELDLYISFYDSQTNQYSEPKNLGTKINTELSETAPFLAYNNKTLYFASLGHNSFGDYDLFMTERLDDSWTNWSAPVNLGKYINSKFDENSFWLNPLGKTAYIASYDSTEKRKGIYKVLIPKELQPKNYAIISGEVFVKSNAKIFPNKILKISVSNGKEISYYYTNIDHRFIIPVTGADLKIQIEDNEYTSNTIHFNTDKISEPIVINENLILSKKRVETFQNGDLEIYFDYDKYDIKTEDKEKLKILAKSNNTPVSNIYITAYTDENGSDSYNLRLSNNRANKVKEYLVSLGFSSNQIIAIGKGKLETSDTNSEKNRKAIIRVEQVIE